MAITQVFASPFTSAKRGAANLVEEYLNFKSEFSKIDKEGRYVLVRGDLEGQKVTLINVYNPPGENVTCFKNIFYCC